MIVYGYLTDNFDIFTINCKFEDSSNIVFEGYLTDKESIDSDNNTLTSFVPLKVNIFEDKKVAVFNIDKSQSKQYNI